MTRMPPKWIIGTLPTLEYCFLLALRQYQRDGQKRRLARFKAKNPERWKAKRRQWDSNWRNVHREECRKRWNSNYKKYLTKIKAYHASNKDRRNARLRAFLKKNQQLVRSRATAYYRKNIQVRIKHVISKAISRFVFKNGKAGMDFVGCKLPDLMLHLQQQFQPGMAWNNYGKWQIDHRIPCSKFDLTKPEQVRQCFHFTNLQPMWKFENQSKQDKISSSHQNQQQFLTL